MAKREIKPDIKELLLNAIKKDIKELELKPILEMNSTIGNLYDEGLIAAEDFYQVLEEVVEHVDEMEL